MRVGGMGLGPPTVTKPSLLDSARSGESGVSFMDSLGGCVMALSWDAFARVVGGDGTGILEGLSPPLSLSFGFTFTLGIAGVGSSEESNPATYLHPGRGGGRAGGCPVLLLLLRCWLLRCSTRPAQLKRLGTGPSIKSGILASCSN